MVVICNNIIEFYYRYWTQTRIHLIRLRIHLIRFRIQFFLFIFFGSYALENGFLFVFFFFQFFGLNSQCSWLGYSWTFIIILFFVFFFHEFRLIFHIFFNFMLFFMTHADKHKFFFLNFQLSLLSTLFLNFLFIK